MRRSLLPRAVLFVASSLLPLAALPHLLLEGGKTPVPPQFVPCVFARRVRRSVGAAMRGRSGGNAFEGHSMESLLAFASDHEFCLRCNH